MRMVVLASQFKYFCVLNTKNKKLLLMKMRFFLGVNVGGFSRLGAPEPNEMKKEPSLQRKKNKNKVNS